MDKYTFDDFFSWHGSDGTPPPLRWRRSARVPDSFAPWLPPHELFTRPSIMDCDLIEAECSRHVPSVNSTAPAPGLRGNQESTGGEVLLPKKSNISVNTPSARIIPNPKQRPRFLIPPLCLSFTSFSALGSSHHVLINAELHHVNAASGRRVLCLCSSETSTNLRLTWRDSEHLQLWKK